MQWLQAQDNRLRGSSRAEVQQFHTFKTLEDPAHCRSSGGLVDGIVNLVTSLNTVLE
jgi:hypothetical protein